MEKQCRFANKKLNRKYHRDLEQANIENMSNSSASKLPTCSQDRSETDKVSSLRTVDVDMEDQSATEESEVEDDGIKYDQVNAFNSNMDEVEDSVRAENVFVHPGSNFETSDCDDHEVESSALSKENNPKIRFKCTKCDKTFSRYGVAKNHCKEDVDSWKCEKCGEIIKHTNNKSRHLARCMKKTQMIRNNHSETRALVPGSSSNPVTKCNFCGKVVGTPASLRAHISRQHKEDRLGDYKCQKCNFVTKTESELKKHDTLKHKSVKFKCPKCGYICCSASGLKKHRLAFHRPDASPDESPLGFVGSDLPPIPNISLSSTSSQHLDLPSNSSTGSNQISGHPEQQQLGVMTIRSSETADLHGEASGSHLEAGQQGGGGRAVGSCQLSGQNGSVASSNQTPTGQNQTPGVYSVGVSGSCQSPAPVLYSNVSNVIFETVALTQKNERSLSFSEY